MTEEIANWRQLRKAQLASRAKPDPQLPIRERLLRKIRADARLSRFYLASYEAAPLHGAETKAYQEWLSEKLPHSGLAPLIAGGLDALPDIYPAMPWFIRSLETLRRPRNYEQLLNHMYDFLEAYIEPGRRTPWPMYLSYTVMVSTLLLLLGAGIWAELSGHFKESLTGLLSLSTCLVALLFILRIVRPRYRLPFASSHRVVNIALLSDYLDRAYSDTTEPTEISLLKTSDLTTDKAGNGPAATGSDRMETINAVPSSAPRWDR